MLDFYVIGYKFYIKFAFFEIFVNLFYFSYVFKDKMNPWIV